MATETKKFVTLVGGKPKQGIGIDSSAGAGDADKLISTGSDGKIDTSLMPTGIAADTVSATASEDLAAGDVVNTWDDSGTLKARKADATSVGKEVRGYVQSAVTSGNSATIYREGTITGLSSLSLGEDYYLSTTAGAVTSTAPSSDGNISQYVGWAKSATELCFEPRTPIEIDIA